MNSIWHRALVLGALIMVLAAVNFTIWQRESVLRDGQKLLLELAPVDPRSLMQGDYMALRFAVGQKIPRDEKQGKAGDGYVVVTRDERGIGVFARVYRTGEPLAADEARIRYRVRKNDVRIVTNAYFFQEGQGEQYTKARFGELRLTGDGEALLVGMNDKDLKPIGNRENR